MKETLTRASRNRRVVALMAWAGLLITAFSLWNSRVSGFIRVVTDEPIAFILAAFSAFVSVFAWMLYNPARKSASESPGLFLAMGATLFPPPMIGFCLMPMESPLRWWLAFGIFLLCIIAVLSHVPDEFFDVPRGRHTYFTPIPAFDRVRDTALDPDAAWFAFNDLSRIVIDTERPSLVPRAYLQRSQVRPANNTTAVPRSPLTPYSDVDDILGPDFDIDFMSGTTIETPQPTDTQRHNAARGLRHQRSAERPSSAGKNGLPPLHQNDRVDRSRGTAVNDRNQQRRLENVYSAVNPQSLRIAHSHHLHRTPLAQAGQATARNPRQRLANSIQVQHNRGRHDSRAGELPTDRSNRRSPAPLRSHQSSDRHLGEVETQRQQESREAQRGQEQQRADAAQAAVIQRDAAAKRQRERLETERLKTEHARIQRADQARKEREARESKLEAPAAELSDHATSYRRKGRKSAAETAQRSKAAPDASANGAVIGATPLIQEYRQPVPAKSSRSVAPVSEAPAAPNRPETRSGRRQLPPLERTQDEQGGELVEGVMTVRFDKGQKRANLHVPFSPPLPGMPEVECECVGGEDLRLKVPVRQSYGIRIEARRSHAEEPLEAEIGFAAVYTP